MKTNRHRNTSEDSKFMDRALSLARQAYKKGEVPVGAVLVREGKILAQGYNRTRLDKDPMAHAEIVALRKAIKTIKNERFLGCTLYVTLEPCAMCAGAIIQARLPVVVFGAKDPKAGACGSVLSLLNHRNLNHRPRVIKGIASDESAHLLKSFFRERR